ncbi:MAG: PepSY domain-containing protein [Lysobacter sp.]
MLTRSTTTVASLILLTATAVTAGDALAQRTRADARESNRALTERAADRSHADHRDERGADHRALSAAVRRVERRTGGQVLSAERVPYDGRDINRIKVVDASGRVRVYVDDPRARAPQGRVRTRGDDN